MPLETEHLILSGHDNTRAGQVVCIALAHNEFNLLAPFLNHYRAFGDITFVVVDDRSTDDSSDYLAAQPDVTVMVPKEGSTYAKHKREWRGQTLDAVAVDRWVLAPDMDEHLVWHGAPQRTFADLLTDMKREQAEVLYAIMIDMYADKPLSQHVFTGGDLSASFDLFDDPTSDPSGTWMERGPSRFLESWPTPKRSVVGGMRQRLMEDGTAGSGLRRLGRRVLGKIGDHRSAGSSLARRITKTTGSKPTTALTKVPLVKWRRGLRFYGGAHCLNQEMTLASERAALLHYPITRGMEGVQHIISRGQHMADSAYYKDLLKAADKSPKYRGTRQLRSLDDLSGVILPPKRST